MPRRWAIASRASSSGRAFRGPRFGGGGLRGMRVFPAVPAREREPGRAGAPEEERRGLGDRIEADPRGRVASRGSLPTDVPGESGRRAQ
jgi:hypothetical protein